MEKPQSKFPTMENSAATTVVNVSGTPTAGKLVKRGNAVAGDLSGPKGGHVLKQTTSKRAYGIKTTMPSYQDPQVGPTQGNGRLFKEVMNRTAPNFQAGVVDHN
ncbi:hypothetical protein UFOVP115_72 [uncultured Caudovirales phage]|uniref:Uncharacterized protein n=1 Tax=uncultured Caudovirales phage TaxID=2100421 RepID=A0A6J5L871_9CAUD|nr:hypothetical protein UFOVP115_72 [uncultured Caudovirales phage]